jgi:hypothetical protein
MPLRAALEQRYPEGSERRVAIREKLIEVCQNYLANGHGDGNAEQRLCSPDNALYWQQLSEVLVAHQLTVANINFAHPAQGPDFRIDRDGRRIWIEVITPTGASIPPEWFAPVGQGGVRDFPHQEILLRWTAAIKQKAEVLLGNPQTGAPGYLAAGTVGADDSYVIAVNGRLLRGFDGAFDALTGISQFPFAVEATLAVGPLQIRIDRHTLEHAPPEHEQRYLIHKPVGLPVPADTFLDQRFAPISAIWATDLDEVSVLDRVPKMAVVHNPDATNPIESGLLPAQNEYLTEELDAETYQLKRVDGTLAGTGNDEAEVEVG